MDNADLESLKLVPGRLKPKFGPDVTEYEVMLSSAAAQVRVDAMASDSGASYAIVGCDGGERSVTLREGLNSIVIEVSAPDGTTKRYTINVTKLAANLAELSNLMLTPGKLDRAYKKKTSEYYATLGWAVTEVKVKAVKQDPKMVVDVDGNPPDGAVPLLAMETTIHINVTSPDKTNTKVYTVHMMREDSGYRTSPVTDESALVCAVCCAISQSPRKLVQCGHSFCTACMAVSQRTDKRCPECGKKAPPAPPYDEPDTAAREKLLDFMIKCFYCSTAVGSSDLLGHAVQCPSRWVTCPSCNVDVKQSTVDDSSHTACTESCKTCGQKYPSSLEKFHTAMCIQGPNMTSVELAGHSVKVSAWEKKLRIENSDSFDELFESGKKFEVEYHKVKRSTELSDIKEKLKSAATAYANAIAVNPKAAKAHHRLGVIMEELHELDDMFGKTVVTVDNTANKEAKDSSKTEEIDAICQIHGVSKSAPLGDKLRAIDQEYHSLKEKGDSFRADRVQELYAWKSRQASQAERSSFNAANDETYLGKANKKYEDAVCLEPTSYQFNYNLGCSYLTQLKHQAAAARLRVCVGTKPLLKHTRYLLGVALSQAGDPGLAEEAALYLQEGVVSYQHWISCVKRDGASPTSDMTAEAEYRFLNPHYLMGWIYLAELVKEKEKKLDLLLTLVYLVPRILQTIEHRGEGYLTIEAINFTALDNIIAVVNNDQIPIYCSRLSMLISKSPDAGNQKLLEMQVETCRKHVYVEPNNGLALNTLGDALLTLFNIAEDKVLLEEAEVCYRASLKVEGLPVATKSVPSEIQNLKWYKDRSGPAPSKEPTRGGAVKGGAAKRGAPRGGAAGRGGAAVRGGAAGRGGAAVRGGATGRGGAAGRGAAPTRGAGRGTARGAAKCQAKEPGAAVPDKDEEAAPGPVNIGSTLPRLGLARVLGLGKRNVDEQKSLYGEVIKMDRQLHDAYIELGELCQGTMEAVEVYDSFPFSNELSFDDAFIYGEMVQILMKHEKFDDSRLEKALSGYGIVMGWNSLENYVTKLENAYKTKVLRKVYCAVNNKSVDDTDVQQYFKVKLW